MISELPFKPTIPELGKIIDGMVKAGDKILEIYETDFSTEKKEDDSPITQADIESNKILKEVLGETVNFPLHFKILFWIYRTIF